MRRIIILLVAALLVFGMVQTASAVYGVGFGIGLIKNPVNMVDELKLSEEQAAKIRETNEAKFKEISALQDKQRQVFFELQQQRFTPGVKQEQLQAKVDEIKELQQLRQDVLKDYQEQMRSVLTEEQLKRWSEICPRPDGPQVGPKGGRGPGNSAGNSGR